MSRRCEDRRPARRHNNRDRIVTGALELFNTRGYAAVTTNHIAESLGISPGNLYYHFRNKEQIAEAILAELIRDLKEVNSQPPGDLRPERLALYYITVAEVAWQYRSIFRGIAELTHQDGMAAKYRELMRRTNDRELEIFALLRARRRFREPAPPDQLLGMIAESTSVIITGWSSYLSTAHGPANITAETIRRGAAHAYGVLDPYLEPDYAAEVRAAITNTSRT